MSGQGTKREDISFEAVYDMYYDRVYKYACLLLLSREDAEDVTEEAFLAAYARFESYDPAKASPATWLTRIAHNCAVDHRRRAAHAVSVDLSSVPEQAVGDQTGCVEDRETVLWLYSRLPENERELLNLRYVMELKDREVALILGLSEKAVNKCYQRLLAKCRTLLAGAMEN